ncbi:YIP1 family protein [Virgibacillus alimentarius]|uniref:YIP1 family protein n=1 Tax=Virgibacillus alimentarius TaxID=698769 RepID=UPI00049341CA|nr:YIP1 family protein [Virgibacillus alimentarius]
MKCIKCGFEQMEGKFCGQCGTSLSKEIHGTNLSEKEGELKKEEQAATVDNTSTQNFQEETKGASHQQALNHTVTEKTKMYGSYFVNYLKQPSIAFSTRGEAFTHGLISMAIVAFLMALSFYLLVRNFARAAFEGYGDLFTDAYYSGPSLFSVFVYAFIFMIISMGIVVILLYIINHLFGTAYQLKEMIGIYGTHLVPIIVLTGVTFLLILLKSNTIGGYLLLFTLGLVLTSFPLYLISSLLTRQSKNLEPLYAYLIYIISVAIVFGIFVFVMMDSAFGRMLDQIGYY